MLNTIYTLFLCTIFDVSHVFFRPMFYHRAVCLDNIYLPVRKLKDKTDDEYGDAMIKISKLTRACHEEYTAPNQTPHSSLVS